jgi:hypothetical protein
MERINKVLIANRGEIALRIQRACREMGIRTVAVFSTADRDQKHVLLADEAVCIGPAQAPRSYLNMPAIIAAAEVTGADAIHPGFGFLSENADFAESVTKSGFIFIGPRAETMRALGDKASARRLIVGTIGAAEGQVISQFILARNFVHCGTQIPAEGFVTHRRRHLQGVQKWQVELGKCRSLILFGGVRFIYAEKEKWTRTIRGTAVVFRVVRIKRSLLRPETGRRAVVDGIRHCLSVFGIPILHTGTPGNIAAWQLYACLTTEDQIHGCVPGCCFTVTLVKDPFAQFPRILQGGIKTGVRQAQYRLTGKVGSKRVPVHTIPDTSLSRVLGAETVKVLILGITVGSTKTIQGVLQSRTHDVRR